MKIDIHEAWGAIVDRIVGDDELRKATQDVLAFRSAMFDRDERQKFKTLLSLPADMAHAQTSYNEGVVEGYARAMSDLTEGKHIGEMRALLVERKETDA